MYENTRCSVIQKWVTAKNLNMQHHSVVKINQEIVIVMENYEAFTKYAFEEYLRTWENA